MKYIVMECRAGYAVLLDEKGSFWKSANLHYQVGQTVEDPVLMKEPGMQKRGKMRAVMGFAAAAACFLLLFTGYYRDYMVLDTAVYMTINPSVRMDLNRKGQVIRVMGVNEDGEKLLEGYRQGSRGRLAVAEELIERAIQMGYLSEGGRVVINIDAPEEAVFQKYGVELRKDLAEYLEEALTVDIQILEYGKEPVKDSGKGSKEEPAKTEQVSPSDPALSSGGHEENKENVPDAGSKAPENTGGNAPGGSGRPKAKPPTDGGADPGLSEGADQKTGTDSDQGTAAQDSGYSDYGADPGYDGDTYYDGADTGYDGDTHDDGAGSDYDEDTHDGAGSGYDEDTHDGGHSDYKEDSHYE